MYFSTLLMDPFLPEPVGSSLSSWGSGIVTSAQPGGSLWSELTFPVPPWAALGHCGLGWGQLFVTSFLPGGTWVFTCWALHGWPLVGTQLALSAS